MPILLDVSIALSFSRYIPINLYETPLKGLCIHSQGKEIYRRERIPFGKKKILFTLNIEYVLLKGYAVFHCLVLMILIVSSLRFDTNKSV